MLAELIRNANGPVLADDGMVTIVAIGREIVFQPFERRQLQRAGLWDVTPVVAALRAHRYPLVILGGPGSPLCAERWGNEILDAVARYYHPVLQAGGLVATAPRVDSRSASLAIVILSLVTGIEGVSASGRHACFK